MSLYEHAKKEVELAKKKEAEGLEEGEFDYGGACYDSALKAFKSLTEDDHSGMSIKITQHILNRLIDDHPLTPIEDIEENWGEGRYNEKEGLTTYQCSRMGGLFKYVSDSGKVTYNDIYRFQCVDIDTESTYHSGLVNNVVRDLYPITFPYTPFDKPIQVYCDSFLTDEKNGDFDTVGVLYLVTPDNTKLIIDQYFKETETGEWEGIEPKEFILRSHMSNVKGDTNG